MSIRGLNRAARLDSIQFKTVKHLWRVRIRVQSIDVGLFDWGPHERVTALEMRQEIYLTLLERLQQLVELPQVRFFGLLRQSHLNGCFNFVLDFLCVGALGR